MAVDSWLRFFPRKSMAINVYFSAVYGTKVVLGDVYFDHYVQEQLPRGDEICREYQPMLFYSSTM